MSELIKTNIILDAKGSNKELDKRLKKVCKKNKKLNDLYHGVLTSDDYKANDIQLCSLLAFYFNKDKNIIDYFFRKSSLMSENWDKDNYGNVTIEKAIEAQKNYENKTIHDNKNSKNSNCVFDKNIIQKNNCYVRIVERDFVKEEVLLSNFIMKVENVLIADDINEKYATVLFINRKGYKEKREIEIKVLDSVSLLSSTLNSEKFTFRGFDNDLKAIKVLMFETPYAEIKGVKMIGTHMLNNKEVFVFHDKAIDKNNREVKGIKLIEDYAEIQSTLSDAKEIKKQELEQIAPYLFSFNDIQNTSLLWGAVAVNFLTGKLRRNKIKLAYFDIEGESGGGKSATLEATILPVFGYKLHDVLTCASTTQYALERRVSITQEIPIILNEMKEEKLKKDKKDMISDVRRNSYDNSSNLRGRKSLKKSLSRSLFGKIWIVAESIPVETANIERTLKIILAKSFITEEREAALNVLEQNSEIITKLGKSLLLEAMNADEQKLINHIYELRKEDKIYNFDKRISKNIVNAIVGIELLNKVFLKLDLDMQRLTGYNVAMLKDILIESVRNNVLNNKTSTKSIVEYTLETFDEMCMQTDHYKLEKDYDYKIVTNKNNSEIELLLNYKKFYSKFKKYCKDTNYSKELLEADQFVMQIKKTPYIILDSNNQLPTKNFKVSYAVYEKNIDNIQNIQNKKFRCIAINVKKLFEAGIQLDYMLGEYKENIKEIRAPEENVKQLFI